MPFLFLAPMFRLYETYATGAPLVGGKIYTAQPGTVAGPGQSFPKATYTDSTGTVPNANPVVLDGSGKCNLWLSGSYSIAVYDATGVLIESQDNVSGSGGSSGGTGSLAQFYDASLATVNVPILSASDAAAVQLPPIIKTDSSTNLVTITPATGTILGLPSYSLSNQNEWVVLTPQASSNDWKKAA